jgi:hypothetical protein
VQIAEGFSVDLEEASLCTEVVSEIGIPQVDLGDLRVKLVRVAAPLMINKPINEAVFHTDNYI